MSSGPQPSSPAIPLQYPQPSAHLSNNPSLNPTSTGSHIGTATTSSTPTSATTPISLSTPAPASTSTPSATATLPPLSTPPAASPGYLTSTPAPASTPVPTSIPPLTSTPAPSSTAISNPPPPPPPTWLLQSKTPRSTLKFWTKSLIALLTYSITLYIASTASHRHTVLGRVPASWGTWILTILSKAGDIFFALAVQDVCDSLVWRKLAKRWRVTMGTSFAGVPLGWFLSMVSSIGVEGLFRLLWGSLKFNSGKLWRIRMARHGWWSLARLLVLLVFVPGPGIILMANINQTTLFFPTTTTPVTGGLGLYSPSLALSYAAVLGPQISNLVQTMLQDRSLTWKLDPVSNQCKAGKKCRSYLLAGPYLTVAPMPFTQEEGGLDWFRIKDAPFYQVDVWDAPKNLTFDISKEECTLYGGFNDTTDFSMVLCIQQGEKGVISGGWASCQLGISANGTCQEPASRSSNDSEPWTTSLLFHRRRATTTFSRTSLQIDSVTLLSKPTPVTNISSSSLFSSINTFLYRPNLTSNNLRFDLKSAPYTLTQSLAYRLWASLGNHSQSLLLPKDYLLNTLTLPIFLFTPTILPLANQSPPISALGSVLQPNVPAENHITGSYCTSSRRSIPGRETVIAYGIVGGVLMAMILCGKWISAMWPRVDWTEFSMLDWDVLTTVVDQGGEEVRLRDMYMGGGYEEGAVVEKAGELRIGLRMS
ncbi:hypothetical protein GQ43DRAFT_481187 [Delitschia confertaspora ATCC 74209]|uniref:Uncharacterized protein n=1 Tax=Delitschia confertaspora ATCC 74209 TaxID=1513339 RepID=A0A9P4MYH7_9PLEO|nr:hypothetical protein GQ43DRAFT_481187 [Delitschia confertaspora ATCC 74209]